MNILWILLVAVVIFVMFSVLVAAHEYGHYLFARWTGMGVEEFAIGMGKRVKVVGHRTYDLPVPADYVHTENTPSEGFGLEGGSLDRDVEVVDTPNGRVLRETTDFTFRMFPLGGFVRIKGMLPQDDGSETRIPGGFYSKTPLQRLAVLFAGPLFSVIAGMILLFGVYMADGAMKYKNEPVIGIVSMDLKNGNYAGAAARAGLRGGDRIISANGEKIDNFTQFVHVVNINPKKPIWLVYERDGLQSSTILTPELGKVPVWNQTNGKYMEEAYDIKEQGKAGISPLSEKVRLGAGEAFAETINAPALAVEGLFRIIKQPSRAKDEAGGAISMVQMTNEATKQGLATIISLAAMISISVGIFNLLPFPPLDGGQMLIAFAELLRGGKRLSIKVQSLAMTAGFATVILLTAAVLFIDVQRSVERNASGTTSSEPSLAKEAKGK